MDKIVVLITAPSEDEAARIAQTLVGKNLAACVNILKDIRSIYRWKGAVCDESECLMVVKTTLENFGPIEKLVREMHSYEVPEIIALPITHGSKPYLDWLSENTRLG